MLPFELTYTGSFTVLLSLLNPSMPNKSKNLRASSKFLLCASTGPLQSITLGSMCTKKAYPSDTVLHAASRHRPPSQVRYLTVSWKKCHNSPGLLAFRPPGRTATIRRIICCRSLDHTSTSVECHHTVQTRCACLSLLFWIHVSILCCLA